MKPRTLVSLVLWLAMFGPVALVLAEGPAVLPVASPGSPHATSTNPAPAPATPVEKAQVVIVSQTIATPPERVSLTGWLSELVRLAEAGLDSSVQLSFVDSAGTFNLDANKIIYLNDIGVPSEVITAVIQHDAEIAAGLRQVAAAPPPDSTTTRASEVQPAPVKAAPAPRSVAGLVPKPIVHEVPSPTEDQFTLAEPLDFFEPWNEPEERQELSPVRKPYPVQLTAPIVVYRAQGRLPNTTLLQTLP